MLLCTLSWRPFRYEKEVGLYCFACFGILPFLCAVVFFMWPKKAVIISSGGESQMFNWLAWDCWFKWPSLLVCPIPTVTMHITCIWISWYLCALWKQKRNTRVHNPEGRLKKLLNRFSQNFIYTFCWRIEKYFTAVFFCKMATFSGYLMDWMV